MKSLKETFLNILDSGNWKYYEALEYEGDPFISEYDAEQFIFRYFEAGEKEKILNRLSFNQNRNIHTVSCFLLGMLFKDLIMEQETLKPDIRYLWFIACLYHDHGYYIENNISNNLDYIDIETLQRTLNVQNKLFKTDFEKPYSRETIENYYNFCWKEIKIVNHGYVGSFQLYDSLIKNYNNTKAEAIRKGITRANESEFIYNHLHWAENHKDFYKQTADIILLHNIWFCTKKEDEENYIRNGLSDLIIKKPSQRLSYRENRFLFLLLLSDSIEPVKTYGTEILKKINIRVDNKTHKIIIAVIKDDFAYREWFNKIKNLETWLKIKIKRTNKKLVLEFM